MRIGIGIDTGGTYTDAVVYDFESKSVLGSAKALTTGNDLSIGILNALDALPADKVSEAELISLSTTLATNACVEDRGGNAKLIFFGGNRRVIDELGGKYGLPASDDIYIQESYTEFSGRIEREPDWELFESNAEHGFDDADGVGIVEMNAVRNGAVVERKAKELFLGHRDIPVICGSELFSELNSLQRASGTLLNARLFPVIQEFLEAIRTALKKRDIHASVVIVKSNGSLMTDEYAVTHPVETIICGPASSVIGGRETADEQNCVIVDMGGTTTDIALIRNGEPVRATDGVSIGKWKTYVDGLYVKTVGLGGDSALHYRDGRLVMESYRIIPLCVTAASYPCVKEDLRRLLARPVLHTKPLYEHYVLIRDIEDSPRYTDEEKAFCRAIRPRPLMLRDAAEAVGSDMYNLNAARLIKDGVVQLSGLTPTDIMHIKGDFSKYDAEASMLAASFAAFNLNTSVEKLCETVYYEIKRKLYRYIAEALMENTESCYSENGADDALGRIIDMSFDTAGSGGGTQPVVPSFKTSLALVGIGAPIRQFLPEVAERLGTRAVIPPHFEVANALGAILGNVYASSEAQIRNGANGTGFTVFAGDSVMSFSEQEDAVSFAKTATERCAREEAEQRGAHDVCVTFDVINEEAPIGGGDGRVYLGTTVKAHAEGGLGFSRRL